MGGYSEHRTKHIIGVNNYFNCSYDICSTTLCSVTDLARVAESTRGLLVSVFLDAWRLFVVVSAGDRFLNYITQDVLQRKILTPACLPGRNVCIFCCTSLCHEALEIISR